MSESWAQYQKLVLKLLEQHDEKLAELQSKIIEGHENSITVINDINSLKEDVEALTALIKEGSANTVLLLSRVDKMELSINKLEITEAERKESSKALVNFKRGLVIAVAGTAITVLWEIIQYFIGK